MRLLPSVGPESRCQSTNLVVNKERRDLPLSLQMQWKEHCSRLREGAFSIPVALSTMELHLPIVTSPGRILSLI
jgi:hypothetical protein